MKFKAFTLAEVLITLGIIGIVAAMTLPGLIQRNNNIVVETRLKKFYSVINQAIIMAEGDYGDKKDWFVSANGSSQFDENGKPIPGTNATEIWFNKYIAPYMKIIESKTLNDGSFIVYFEDGSALRQRANTADWYFYTGNAEKCMKKEGLGSSGVGTCSFPFLFAPNSTDSAWKYHVNKGMEPYKYKWDGQKSSLYSGARFSCAKNVTERLYCTAIIQMNNWKIPEDYPLKVSY